MSTIADEKGYRTRVSSYLTSASGMQYQFSTIFHSELDTDVHKYVLELRYRQQTKRDWLYYEIVALVSASSAQPTGV